MLNYIVYRLLLIIPILFGVTIVVFILNQLIPGDPVDFMLDIDATEADREYIRSYLGLDKPLIVQYFIWLSNILQGDFGMSVTRQTEVSYLILGALKNTAILIAVGGTIAFIIALIIGIFSAMYPKSKMATLSNVLGISCVSIPNFWAALMLIGLFAVFLGWLPASGIRSTGQESSLLDMAKHLVLPAIAVGLTTIGTMTRIVRSTFVDIFKQDFVVTLRAKGQGKGTIMKHVFKNGLPPVLVVAGLEIGSLMGGSVITESIFNWPGVGKLLYDAISQRDYPLIQGGILIISLLFVSVNMIVDVLHAYVDPRIRKSLGGGAS
ncbi:ABC transporter permease [Aquibacillus albus]|uniref:Peptide/nickel transport system permease protein n=1 Tax=Aquibacillus albus TaxID=1168171 RepID=A0ABS2N6G7_9BACI|nr:ABC transporter permease [Aquibacillus albus]MBM7573703.1 peptide/nickel transport system permease protein [Aquibacillus albus]